MAKENGNISIHTENLLPIIKKWLYSDEDIFVRELISNGCDAISKLKRLCSIGEAEVPEDTKYEIVVSVNKENNTIKISDNGIGMDEEEVKKYINQVAFSGAEDFLAKYKDKMDEGSDIIGHFGLGFYSAFMVADKVQIDTLSYKNGAQAVRWICSGGTEYEIEESDRTERGTTITLYVNEDDKEYLEEYKMRQVINKHCSFLPVEIFVEDENEHNDAVERKALNDTKPLWMKNPKDCTDEEYKEFYKKVFMDFNDPLFWVHLNVDYPFNLKGILYFPKFNHEFEATEGQVKLYNNQVFVADNVKEVIPDFLLLLKGTLDFADLPLNVSRSFLQNDNDVKKISRHIINKVADKLKHIYKHEKDRYIECWKDISIFIKYGCIRDQKFYENIKDIIIFKDINGNHLTLQEYLDANKEKHENKVFYISDEVNQAQYVNLFKENDLNAIELTSNIDNHFITFLEENNKDVKFARIDSDISDTLKAKDDENESEEDKKALQEKVEGIFKKTIGDDKVKVSVEGLKNDNVPAMMLISEQSRRMAEMSKMFGGIKDVNGMFSEETTLVVNKNNPMVKKLIEISEDTSREQDANLICEHVYDLARISFGKLGPEEMNKFINRSNDILMRVIK